MNTGRFMQISRTSNKTCETGMYMNGSFTEIGKKVRSSLSRVPDYDSFFDCLQSACEVAPMPRSPSTSRENGNPTNMPKVDQGNPHTASVT